MFRGARGEEGGELTVGTIFILHVQFAQTKVAESNMAGVIEENVLGLEITVDDVETVETFEGAEKFGRVETSPIDVEPLFAIPPAPEISYSEPEATLPWEAPLFF